MMSETQFVRLLKRVNELEQENERLREENERLMNGMELAWGLIANAEHLVGSQWHSAVDRNRRQNKKEVSHD